jgi:hypothetical protein
MNDGACEPTTELDSPDIRRCTVCGASASFGFGPPGATMSPTDAWYCGEHRQEGGPLTGAVSPDTGRHAHLKAAGSKHSPSVRHSLLKALNPGR